MGLKSSGLAPDDRYVSDELMIGMASKISGTSFENWIFSMICSNEWTTAS